MRIIVGFMICFLPIVTLADDHHLLETTDQSQQRHQAEQYQQYKDNNYQAPLGGYQEKLSDPVPTATPSPGYINPYNSPSTSTYQVPSMKSNGYK